MPLRPARLQGKWEARIGRVVGNKYVYLGTYETAGEGAGPLPLLYSLLACRAASCRGGELRSSLPCAAPAVPDPTASPALSKRAFAPPPAEEAARAYDRACVKYRGSKVGGALPAAFLCRAALSHTASPILKKHIPHFNLPPAHPQAYLPHASNLVTRRRPSSTLTWSTISTSSTTQTPTIPSRQPPAQRGRAAARRRRRRCRRARRPTMAVTTVAAAAAEEGC